jgi:hypothetical protein
VTRTSLACRLTTLAVTAMVAAGCGSDTAPADAVPELADRLEQVDTAVATGDEARIRQRVEALVAATESARDEGSLDDEDAERILAAADAMLARLPAEEPAPEPPSPPTSSPTTETPEPPEEDEDDEGDEGDNSGPGGGDSRDKPEKGKPDKGKGHGKG